MQASFWRCQSVWTNHALKCVEHFEHVKNHRFLSTPKNLIVRILGVQKSTQTADFSPQMTQRLFDIKKFLVLTNFLKNNLASAGQFRFHVCQGFSGNSRHFFIFARNKKYFLSSINNCGSSHSHSKRLGHPTR